MDFFGRGWDVAERMGLADDLRAICYPIDSLRYMDERGDPYLIVPRDCSLSTTSVDRRGPPSMPRAKLSFHGLKSSGGDYTRAPHG
jgi:hypothetical protein